MTELLPGTPVRARGLRWEVVFTQPVGEQTLCRIRAVDGELRGREFDVLTPFEKLEPIVQDLAFDRAAPLHQWRLYHQSFLLEQEFGSTALLAAQPGRLMPAAYQLVPVMRMLRMSRPRLLLADGVGLGKTIEAGLILAELVARRRAHRILIVSPAGPLLSQWRRELRERFGLRFRVLDRGSLQDIKHSTELGANPFDAEALGLISIDFAKQEKVLQDLERSHFDVVVIDEAHHVARVGGAGNTEDSQRRRLAEVLARQSDGLLLLSATPHDGYDAHFASLMELLDPSLVDGRGALRGDSYRRFVVRRLKSHVRKTTKGLDYDDRLVLPSRVASGEATHPAWAAFQKALLGMVAPQLRRAFKRRNFGEVLAFIALLKRSVSTVSACRKTLQTISERLAAAEERGAETVDVRAQRLRTLRDYRRRLERFGTLSFEEEQDQASLEAEDIAAELASGGAEAVLEWIEKNQRAARTDKKKLKTISAVREAIETLAVLAQSAESEDPKLSALVDELVTIRKAEPNANVLIYTEYSDSQDVVVSALEVAIKDGRLKGKIAQISGDDDEATRSGITERFSKSDLQVLVSTDATAEGLNLHARCHHLVHLELPYNPNRLEQRNGRIDRFGQTHQPVVRYLYLPATFEERLLLRLVQKFERQRSRLSFVPNTLGIVGTDDGASVEGLLRGLSSEDEKLFRIEKPFDFASGHEEDTASTEYQELLAEIDKAIGGFEKTARAHEWLGAQGIAAAPEDAEDATAAQERGRQLVSSALLDFVTDAVTAESAGHSVNRTSDGVIELTLPPTWLHDLHEMPGFEGSTRTLRLTNDLDLTSDAQKRAVGYLGRAHPVVRRALDRVRHLQFTGGEASLDARVSAVAWAGQKPSVVWTFVGQVQTSAGREFERLVAVRVDAGGGIEVLEAPETWMALADADSAIPLKDLWRKHFASWAPAQAEKAQQLATEAFQLVAARFTAQLTEELSAEQQHLGQWLTTRANELCGPARAGDQAEMFMEAGTSAPWRRALPATERLAAFATDATVGAKERREADGVLRLYQDRQAALGTRMHFSQPALSTLGVLMLLPKAG